MNLTSAAFCLTIFLLIFRFEVSHSKEISEKEKKHFLDSHNKFRSNAVPPAADMNFLTWDDHLAKLAQEFVSNCPTDYGMKMSKLGEIGQNLFWGEGAQIDSVMDAWYSEIDSYDYEHGKCAAEQTCGHYTSMMWAKTKKLGCATAQCPTDAGTVQTLIVCNYFPPSNIENEKPYQTGPPCSKCTNNGGTDCHRKMCISPATCKEQKLSCACRQICLNCGVLEKSTCKCHCKDGWDAPDCSVPCKNAHDSCGKNPGFPDKTVCVKDAKVKDEFCREMCGQCKPVDQADSGKSCCNGKICDKGQSLNQKCRCVAVDDAVKEVQKRAAEKISYSIKKDGNGNPVWNIETDGASRLNHYPSLCHYLVITTIIGNHFIWIISHFWKFE